VTRSSCIVIGAGVSGLVAARELQSAGWRVVVLEGAREVGGRMATGHVGKGTFDHGAQFFTVRSTRFERVVTGWLQADVAHEWTRGFADAEGNHSYDGCPRYRGSGGMISIARHLARALDVRTGERVIEANVSSRAWEVRTQPGTRDTGAAMLLTAPVPLALDLAASGNFELPDAPRRAARERQLRSVPCPHGAPRRTH